MNWTGGSLFRHSRKARKDTFRKQKKHFEKVRKHLGLDGDEVSPEPSQHRCLRGGIGIMVDVQPRELRSSHVARQPFRIADLSQGGRSDECQWISGSQREQGARLDSNRETGYFEVNRKNVPSEVNSRGVNTTASYMRNGSSVVDEQSMVDSQIHQLLEKQDWVGLGPTHPVKMNFNNREARDSIGKRKRNAVSLAHRMQRRPYHTDHGLSRDFAAPAEGSDAKDIKIRIGRDALASKTSMQLMDHVPAHADAFPSGNSSDPMLFDEEGPYISAQESGPQPRSVSSKQDSSDSDPESAFMVDLQGIQPASSRGVHGPASISSMRTEYDATKCTETRCDSVERHDLANARTFQGADGTTALATRYAGFDGCRLHVAFDQRKHALVETITQLERTYASQAIDTNHAQLSTIESGGAMAGSSAASLSDCASPSIADNLCSKNSIGVFPQHNAPWSEPLAIFGDRSSPSIDLDIGLTDSSVSRHGTLLEGEENWRILSKVTSQQATFGNSTYMGTPSCICASSPPNQRTKDTLASDRWSQFTGQDESHSMAAGARRRGTFVFTDHDEFAFDSMRDGAPKKRQITPSEIDRSGLGASSLAVAPPVSSKFMLDEAYPTHGACIEDATCCRVPSSPWRSTSPPLKSSAISDPVSKLARQRSECRVDLWSSAVSFETHELKQTSLNVDLTGDSLRGPVTRGSSHYGAFSR